MNEAERQFRKTGRLVTILFLLYVPVVVLVGFGLGKVFDSSWPLFVSAGLWMAITLVVSVQRFVAHYRWKGKYPHYWLFRKTK